MRYKIPHLVLTTFLERAANNFGGSQRKGHDHVETLSLLVGKKDGEEITATEIIFPEQFGTPDYVEDLGKFFF